MDECNIIRLNNLISYISPTENPLSANVVMIQGKEALWLYDVGNHPDIPQVIEQFRDGRNVNVILSHFHEDHTGGLPDIAYNEIYQGKYTYRHKYSGWRCVTSHISTAFKPCKGLCCVGSKRRVVLSWRCIICYAEMRT